jgi:uncharacterized coiled-coil DUF342 family protein
VYSLEEILKQILSSIEDLKQGQEDLKQGQEGLIQGQNEIKSKLDKTYNYLEEVDAKHVTNHLQLVSKLNETNDKIDSVQSDVNNLGVKVYTSDNKIIEINRKLNAVK